jgi:hypothetical protein
MPRGFVIGAVAGSREADLQDRTILFCCTAYVGLWHKAAQSYATACPQLAKAELHPSCIRLPRCVRSGLRKPESSLLARFEVVN